MNITDIMKVLDSLGDSTELRISRSTGDVRLELTNHRLGISVVRIVSMVELKRSQFDFFRANFDCMTSELADASE